MSDTVKLIWYDYKLNKLDADTKTRVSNLIANIKNDDIVL